VVARLREIGASGVRGNHDSAALGGQEIELFNADARRAAEWTRSVITPETRAWLAAQPLRRQSGDYALVHGSLRDPTWEYITPTAVARANLALLETPTGLFGHTHLPAVHREDDREPGAPGDGSTVELDERPTLLNPGSVGQPRDGDPRSAYLVLDTHRREARWGRVSYDIAGTQAAMRHVGLPDRLVARLDYGL
jgi:diadenosine tetraphosphatase ApaH/serine/threonine PP2A family protein phosphatase